ncbi:hypothetical protein AAFF_G00055630 [Aldrovandia affinis]|uniref:Uncharacterized protein n=1 Tax=Aldrovandia affinis TaxID=143900 RepID=A0AAD7S0M8_9TELE|nr:hypothetical protein AAFF_G00055630 [Aldrovandia affinis]
MEWNEKGDGFFPFLISFRLQGTAQQPTPFKRSFPGTRPHLLRHVSSPSLALYVTDTCARKERLSSETTSLHRFSPDSLSRSDGGHHHYSPLLRDKARLSRQDSPPLGY